MTPAVLDVLKEVYAAFKTFKCIYKLKVKRSVTLVNTREGGNLQKFRNKIKGFMEI